MPTGIKNAPRSPVDRAFAGVGRAVDRVVELLAHEDAEVRTGAAEALYRLGGVGLVRLIAVLQRTEDAMLRVMAMRTLGALGVTLPVLAVSALNQALAEHDD